MMPLRFISPFATAYLIALFAVLGLVAGSFCNAWAWRIAHGESIARGRSHCAVCGHGLGARDLVPVLSYLFLKGRCRYCGAPISPRYPAVELLSAAFFLSVLLRYGLFAPLAALRWLLVGCLLLVIALVDAETQRIPDRLLAGIALLFALAPLEGGWAAVKNGLLGGVAVSLPLLLFVLLADRVAGRETMGGGDIKLFFVLGLHFGPPLTLLLLIFACLFGVLFGLVAQRGRKPGEPSRPFPFGPAIAASAWLVALCGAPLLHWYLGLFF